jgi:hypothetical protein
MTTLMTTLPTDNGAPSEPGRRGPRSSGDGQARQPDEDDRLALRLGHLAEECANHAYASAAAIASPPAARSTSGGIAVKRR